VAAPLEQVEVRIRNVLGQMVGGGHGHPAIF
jgi:hypothetical protein